MSFNNHHINNTIITRDNYEEYFLLYVDEELTVAEKAAVDAFAMLHPDLKEELDILLSTKLPLQDINLENKQVLFADSMKVSTVDESLLLYIDNELPSAETAKVEEKIKADADFKRQHQLLLKTKVDAAEKIIYPYKEELYHKTERRIQMYWWRIAVAAVIIIWAGSVNWFADEDTTGPVALQNTQPAAQQPAAIAKTPAAKPDVKEAVAPKQSSVSNNTETIIAPKETYSAKTAVALPATKATGITNTNEPASIEEPEVSATIPVDRVALQANGFQKASQQIINNAVVTSEIPARNINTEAHAATPVPAEDAVATITNEKSGSLKGFLRKTTRFIERTTNINPVNADDELLIGAVSISLK
jgi:hypothetical protein